MALKNLAKESYDPSLPGLEAIRSDAEYRQCQLEHAEVERQPFLRVCSRGVREDFPGYTLLYHSILTMM